MSTSLASWSRGFWPKRSQLIRTITSTFNTSESLEYLERPFGDQSIKIVMMNKGRQFFFFKKKKNLTKAMYFIVLV